MISTQRLIYVFLLLVKDQNRKNCNQGCWILGRGGVFFLGGGEGRGYYDIEQKNNNNKYDNKKRQEA